MNEILETYFSETYMRVIYGFILGWTVFSIIYILRVWRFKDTSKVNEYLFDSIPSVFTTLGVLGTFLGIFYGLIDFKETDITGSIPKLLAGMKTAFLSSIIGISLSLVLGKLAQIGWSKAEGSSPPKPNSEISILQDISETLNNINNQSLQNHKDVQAMLSSNKDSIRNQVQALALGFADVSNSSTQQTELLGKLEKGLLRDEDSVVAQLIAIKNDQVASANDAKAEIKKITKTLGENHKLLTQKFDDFSELLAKNNTEALVDVMKSATEQFNAQMSELCRETSAREFC
ncbi:MAG: hypothetical protein COA58_03335 [Bacteroidetes bacterium]|nr:MAG: hypothetical protein COA58_03335 [Bacteroidota bacterium]